MVIVNYGMGNLYSVANALSYLNSDFIISSDSEIIDSADAYILPGVGAFDKAMENITSSGLAEVLTRNVMELKKPFMGICLGMQMLAKDSEEGGYHAGLGWIEGSVKKIEDKVSLRLPHVGWNNVDYVQQAPFFNRVKNNSDYYFDHLYKLNCDSKYILATCDYGDKIIAAVRWNNIFAVQFHPEKSRANGLKLIRNFLNTI